MSAELAVLAADPSRLADVDPAELPRLAGEAAALHALLLARVVAGAAASQPVAPAPRMDRAPDKLLTAAEAAERLGVGARWVYRHADKLPFTRKLASGTLRFSERGLARWAETRR